MQKVMDDVAREKEAELAELKRRFEASVREKESLISSSTAGESELASRIRYTDIQLAPEQPTAMPERNK